MCLIPNPITAQRPGRTDPDKEIPLRFSHHHPSEDEDQTNSRQDDTSHIETIIAQVPEYRKHMDKGQEGNHDRDESVEKRGTYFRPG